MIIENGCITEGQRMTEFMRNAFAADDSVKNLSLLAGIIWGLPSNPKIILDEPILSTFNAVIYGSMCMYSASVVAEQLPTKGKWIFAGLIGASAVYHLGKFAYYSYTGKVYNRKNISPLIHIQVTNTTKY